AVELAPRITVNCVAPGWVDTEMSTEPYAREGGSGKGEIEETIPLGRVATPQDVAGPIVFLCSDLARHITGEVLNVNGGSVLCGCLECGVRSAECGTSGQGRSPSGSTL